MARRNPFAHSRTEPEIAEADYPNALAGESRFAVPDHLRRDAPYIDALGWAPRLDLSPTSVPDTSRLGTEPRRDYRPDPVRPPQEFFGQLDADKDSRHRVESVDADGWEETKDGFGFPQPRAGAARFAANPRAVPPPETRPTERMAPRSYNFWRPFMTNQAKMGDRNLNGVHFSMASHRRTYDILGMAPPRRPGGGSRNTYRIDPVPWDTDIVDKTPPNSETPQYRTLPTVEVAYGSRSWRLG